MSSSAFDHLYQKIRFSSWDRLREFYHSKLGHNWLFRGQTSNEWLLTTSLERAVKRAGLDPVDAYRIEKGLLRRFKRQVHHYVATVPDDRAWMEWLALMQHYGAPTRLLDWTYSFFVAAYFAVEHVALGECCSIWGFDGMWWYEKALSALPQDAVERLDSDPNTKDPETVDAIVNRSPPLPLVFPLNPERLNERLALQQGAFLVPGDVSRGFMENLDSLAKGSRDPSHLCRLDLECSKPVLQEAIRELDAMNVNRTTLFPGLDGFSQNLKNLILIPDALATEHERLRAPG